MGGQPREEALEGTEMLVALGSGPSVAMGTMCRLRGLALVDGLLLRLAAAAACGKGLAVNQRR